MFEISPTNRRRLARILCVLGIENNDNIHDSWTAFVYNKQRQNAWTTEYFVIAACAILYQKFSNYTKKKYTYSQNVNFLLYILFYVDFYQ